MSSASVAFATQNFPNSHSSSGVSVYQFPAATSIASSSQLTPSDAEQSSSYLANSLDTSDAFHNLAGNKHNYLANTLHSNLANNQFPIVSQASSASISSQSVGAQGLSAPNLAGSDASTAPCSNLADSLHTNLANTQFPVDSSASSASISSQSVSAKGLSAPNLASSDASTDPSSNLEVYAAAAFSKLTGSHGSATIVHPVSDTNSIPVTIFQSTSSQEMHKSKVSTIGSSSDGQSAIPNKFREILKRKSFFQDLFLYLIQIGRSKSSHAISKNTKQFQKSYKMSESPSEGPRRSSRINDPSNIL